MGYEEEKDQDSCGWTELMRSFKKERGKVEITKCSTRNTEHNESNNKFKDKKRYGEFKNIAVNHIVPYFMLLSYYLGVRVAFSIQCCIYSKGNSMMNTYVLTKEIKKIKPQKIKQETLV